MGSNTEYITIEGDRWDTVAYKAYGDATKMNPIIEANSAIPLVDIFEGGVRLVVPIKEVQSGTDKNSLPPWKRAQTGGEKQAAATAPLLLNIETTGGLGSFDNSFD